MEMRYLEVVFLEGRIDPLASFEYKANMESNKICMTGDRLPQKHTVLFKCSCHLLSAHLAGTPEPMGWRS